MTADEAVCGLVFSRCVCSEPAGHPLPHACHGENVQTGGECLGEWNSEDDIVTYPGGEKTFAEALLTWLENA